MCAHLRARMLAGIELGSCHNCHGNYPHNLTSGLRGERKWVGNILGQINIWYIQGKMFLDVTRLKQNFCSSSPQSLVEYIKETVDFGSISALGQPYLRGQCGAWDMPITHLCGYNQSIILCSLDLSWIWKWLPEECIQTVTSSFLLLCCDIISVRYLDGF